MSWRTVIISSRCKLDLKMGYLVVRGEDVKRIYLDEIGLLLIENPAVALTGCLLSALTEKYHGFYGSRGHIGRILYPHNGTSFPDRMLPG